MRKKIFLLFPLCLLAVMAVWAAAAGDAADPLASLSYLNGVFSGKVDAAVDARLDSSGALLQDGAGTAASGAAWTEARLKRDDVLQASAGDGVLLLAGSGRVDYFSSSSGAVVDVTDGTVVPSGGSLIARHRYLTAEDTSASFTVTSKTAVVDWQGSCTLNYSASTDYNAMAAALKALHLFQGSTTGYGQGFDLEEAPTRLQALIMFIRVLGEEDEALAWNGGNCPFTDVQPGSSAARYVGYAYEKGYTNGWSATQFLPSGPVSAGQYTEFLLRALGYSSTANTDVSDALVRARNAGVLTEGEAAMLQRDPFLRAELVYISYYALEAQVAGTGRTLGELLVDKGVYTQFERDSAPGVIGWRL